MPNGKLRRFIYEEYSWIHTSTGLSGNFLFFVGSIFSFWEPMQTIGVWLFVIGSLFMLIGALGNAYVQKINREKLQNRQ